MVGGKGIDAGLDVGEILLEQRRLSTFRRSLDAWIGSGLRRRALALVLSVPVPRAGA